LKCQDDEVGISRIPKYIFDHIYRNNLIEMTAITINIMNHFTMEYSRERVHKNTHILWQACKFLLDNKKNRNNLSLKKIRKEIEKW